MKYSCKTRLPFSKTGVSAGLSVLGAAQIIEDGVCAFFATFGKDNASLLRDYNAQWVFTKNKFSRLAPVKWNEDITVEVFLSKKSAATVVVDTTVKNGGGKIAVAARTEACVIDLDSMRVRRVSSVDFPEDIAVYPSAADFDFTRFDLSAPKKEYSFIVPSTSIDCGGHLNNVEYLRFVLNSTGAEKELALPVFETEIHFLRQSREGDTLTVYSGESRGTEFYEIKNGDKVVARCGISRVPRTDLNG